MEVTAPHLTHAMPMLIPLNSGVSARQAAVTRGGLLGGDLLRRGAGTSADTLPRPRRISATEALALAPPLRTAGLRGGAARLGRPARGRRPAGHHGRPHRGVVRRPRPHPRPGARPRPAPRSTLRDELTGATHDRSPPARSSTPPASGPATWSTRSRCGPAAAPTWCCAPRRLPGLQAAVFAPVPGETNRFVLVLPQPDGTIYVGLTDEPVDGPIPDVPEPTEPEIGFLLDVVVRGVRRSRCAAPTWSARTPGCGRCSTPADGGETADLSRKHAVLTAGTGVVTVVGGKLTTYRRMAEDAVDAAVAHAGLDAGAVPDPRRCRCSAPPPRASWPGSSSRPGWSAATAPTPRWCSTTARDGHRADRRRAARADRRRHPGHARRAGLRGHPRGRRRRRRPARPAYPDRPGPRRPGARRTRRRAGAGAGRRDRR